MPTLAATNWKPIFDGPRTDRAWGAIQHVARALEGIEDWSPFGANLSGGAAGAALFFGYLAKATGDVTALGHSNRIMGIAGDLLASNPMEPTLYAGFTGIAWTASHLRDLLEPEAEDPAAGIDEVVALYLDRPDWRESYDLIIGLVGYGVYGLERLPHGRGAELLARVVRHLDQLAVPREEGLAWFTPPEELPTWQREFAPKGYWNLGLAHGIPGVLALLGQALKVGVESATARRLLEGGMAWLLARRNQDTSLGWFGTSLSEGLPWEPHGSRVAWCYGDLGLAVAVLQTARYAGRRDWEQMALQIARDAAARTRENRGVKDAGLCHGAAGNALIFLRLFHATGEPCFLETALDHLDWTLAFHNPSQPYGGFPQSCAEEGEESSMHYLPGLLEGSAGVALALLAALTDQAPNWDRHLLVSLEPGSHV